MNNLLFLPFILFIFLVAAICLKSRWKRHLLFLDLPTKDRSRIGRDYIAVITILFIATVAATFLWLLGYHLEEIRYQELLARLLYLKIGILVLGLCLLAFIYFHGSLLAVIAATLWRRDFWEFHRKYFLYSQIPWMIISCILILLCLFALRNLTGIQPTH